MGGGGSPPGGAGGRGGRLGAWARETEPSSAGRGHAGPVAPGRDVKPPGGPAEQRVLQSAVVAAARRVGGMGSARMLPRVRETRDGCERGRPRLGRRPRSGGSGGLQTGWLRGHLLVMGWGSYDVRRFG